MKADLERTCALIKKIVQNVMICVLLVVNYVQQFSEYSSKKWNVTKMKD